MKLDRHVIFMLFMSCDIKEIYMKDKTKKVKLTQTHQTKKSFKEDKLSNKQLKKDQGGAEAAPADPMAEI